MFCLSSCNKRNGQRRLKYVYILCYMSFGECRECCKQQFLKAPFPQIKTSYFKMAINGADSRYNQAGCKEGKKSMLVIATCLPKMINVGFYTFI